MQGSKGSIDDYGNKDDEEEGAALWGVSTEESRQIPRERTVGVLEVGVGVRVREAGLCEIEVYIQRRRYIMFNFVKNREIYQEFLELETEVENSHQ